MGRGLQMRQFPTGTAARTRNHDRGPAGLRTRAPQRCADVGVDIHPSTISGTRCCRVGRYRHQRSLGGRHPPRLLRGGSWQQTRNVLAQHPLTISSEAQATSFSQNPSSSHSSTLHPPSPRPIRQHLGPAAKFSRAPFSPRTRPIRKFQQLLRPDLIWRDRTTHDRNERHNFDALNHRRTTAAAYSASFGATATSTFSSTGALSLAGGLTLSGTPNGPLHANNGLSMHDHLDRHSQRHRRNGTHPSALKPCCAASGRPRPHLVLTLTSNRTVRSFRPLSTLYSRAHGNQHDPQRWCRRHTPLRLHHSHHRHNSKLHQPHCVFRWRFRHHLCAVQRNWSALINWLRLWLGWRHLRLHPLHHLQPQHKCDDHSALVSERIDGFHDRIPCERLNRRKRLSQFRSATSSAGYGFRDNAGTLEFKNSGGTWQGVTTATSGPSFRVHKNGTIKQ